MNVHILGNLGLDISMGPLQALPAWGTESLVSECTFRPGGAAANTVLALAGLYSPEGLALADVEVTVGSGLGPSLRSGFGQAAGAGDGPVPVALYSVVGDDAQGRSLVRQLAAAGVDVSGVPLMPGKTTSVSVALVHPSGERSFVTDLGALAELDEALFGGWLERIAGPGLFLLTGACLLPGLPPARVAQLFRTLQDRGITTFLDTGWATDDWAPETVRAWRETLAEVDIFLPNELEAKALTGKSGVDGAAQELQAISGGTVIVTLGSDGVLVVTGEGMTRIPTAKFAVADSTGAGDSFAAGLLYGLAQGLPLLESVALGQRLAGRILGSRRTFFPGFQALYQRSLAGGR